MSIPYTLGGHWLPNYRICSISYSRAGVPVAGNHRNLLALGAADGPRCAARDRL